jgi:GNAT superfamily N-acetyltransferase
LHQADQLPGFLARLAGVPAGLLNYRIAGGELEVVTLLATPSGHGLGSRLLEAARAKARQHGCSRLWLITTNDNEPAQQFYRSRGMRLVAVHRKALEISRQLKPEIPLIGLGGRPMEDELEFEYRL